MYFIMNFIGIECIPGGPGTPSSPPEGAEGGGHCPHPPECDHGMDVESPLNNHDNYSGASSLMPYALCVVRPRSKGEHSVSGREN